MSLKKAIAKTATRQRAREQTRKESATVEKLKRQLEAEKIKLKQSQDREKVLSNRVESLLRNISALRGSKFSIPLGRPVKVRGGSFCRVTVPDSHGCFIDKDAAAAFLRDLEIIEPAEVVMLGDHLECGGFLAEHHTLGYVHQAEYTFQEDVRATNIFLDGIQKIVPKASYDYIEGNHERRIETWCVTKALRNSKDAQTLLDLFSPDSVLSITKRGMRWIRQGVFYDNLRIPATIRRGQCSFTHGSYTCQNAAEKHVRKFGTNVVYAHTHREDSCRIRTVRDGGLGGWNPGCLCVLQPLWRHTSVTDWTHGYGVQLVNDDGSFLHINVPIIDGVSYMGPLFEAVKG